MESTTIHITYYSQPSTFHFFGVCLVGDELCKKKSMSTMYDSYPLYNSQVVKLRVLLDVTGHAATFVQHLLSFYSLIIITFKKTNNSNYSEVEKDKVGR